MAKKHSETLHHIFVITLWVVGIALVIRLLPVLISDLETGIGMLTGGFTQVAVSSGKAGATSATSTAPASASTTATANGSTYVSSDPASAASNPVTPATANGGVVTGLTFQPPVGGKWGISAVGPAMDPFLNMGGNTPGSQNAAFEP